MAAKWLFCVVSCRQGETPISSAPLPIAAIQIVPDTLPACLKSADTVEKLWSVPAGVRDCQDFVRRVA